MKAGLAETIDHLRQPLQPGSANRRYQPSSRLRNPAEGRAANQLETAPAFLAPHHPPLGLTRLGWAASTQEDGRRLPPSASARPGQSETDPAAAAAATLPPRQHARFAPQGRPAARSGKNRPPASPASPGCGFHAAPSGTTRVTWHFPPPSPPHARAESRRPLIGCPAEGARRGREARYCRRAEVTAAGLR